MHTPFKKEQKQDPPVEHDLYVTLEEIYHGCVKKMKISRRVVKPDGSSKKEDKVLQISIKPGWKSGTKVTFQKEGDQAPGKIPADIVFIIRDKPHAMFKREGSDLRYTARLTLKQVSCDCNAKEEGLLETWYRVSWRGKENSIRLWRYLHFALKTYQTTVDY